MWDGEGWREEWDPGVYPSPGPWERVVLRCGKWTLEREWPVGTLVRSLIATVTNWFAHGPAPLVPEPWTPSGTVDFKAVHGSPRLRNEYERWCATCSHHVCCVCNREHRVPPE